ncbi:S1 family peptidase [Coraliomargarita akajimensis]|uniref:S1 family peptidase n=1 Tax=Coraliomargarita akajimensis TaxID=395922 RepID=UPI00145CB9CC|nr:serine protease [Coraliomargarita akajimensis]
MICVLGQGTIPQGEGEYLDPFTVPDSQPNASDGKSLAQLYLEKRIRELEYELKLARSELARITSTEVSQPTEPASSAATLPARSVQPSEIPQGALVVVSGPKGSGSGFVAEMKGRTFFVTNIHVLGAARGAELNTIDGQRLNLGQGAFLSQNRDVAIVPIEWSGPVMKLSTSLNYDEVAIGDSITVMGNSSGAGVATKLSGEIRGIGATELEVSAEFVPGNSGSPIIHDELGTVVAIASYLKDFSSDSKWTEDTDFDAIRRFGFRLDGTIEWERVSMSELHRQAEAYHLFEHRTSMIWNISYMLLHESKLITSYRDDDSIGHLYTNISTDFNWGRGTGSAHNTQLLKRFIQSLVSEAQNDIVDTRKQLSISFYQRQFNEIVEFRDQSRAKLKQFERSRL